MKAFKMIEKHPDGSMTSSIIIAKNLKEAKDIAYATLVLSNKIHEIKDNITVIEITSKEKFNEQ